jgi:hypothetical protein
VAIRRHYSGGIGHWPQSSVKAFTQANEFWVAPNPGPAFSNSVTAAPASAKNIAMDADNTATRNARGLAMA